MTDYLVEKILHIRNVKKMCNVEKKCVQFMMFVAFYAVLLQNRDLHSFVAISVLSQFTQKNFCVEKNSAKNYAPWRKND